MFDSPIDRHRRTKKSMLPFWLLIVTILIVFGYCLYATVGPNPPIVVSKATTHLTTPLGKDGLPDYAAVLLADAMKGVTPETNAAVPLAEAMDLEEFDKLGPSEKDDLKLVFDEIGAEWPPDDTRAAPSIFSKEVRLGAVRLYRERVPRPADIQIVEIVGDDDQPSGDESAQESEDEECCGVSDDTFWQLSEEEAADDMRSEFYYDNVLDRTWSRSDLPFLADWFDEHAQAFDRVVAGLDRPEWALPKTGWLRGESDPSVWIDMVALMASRQIARTLLARTLYDIGEQDWQAARRNGLAIRKLTAHFAKGPFLVDQLVAVAIDGLAASAIRQLALAPEAPEEELRTLLKEFDSIGPASRMGDTMDYGERYYGLSHALVLSNSPDVTEQLAEYFDAMGPVGTSGPSPQLLRFLGRLSIDWNVALRKLNSTYDRFVAAAKLANGLDRRKAAALIDADLAAAETGITNAGMGFARIGTLAARSELAGDVFMSMSVANLEHLLAVEDRNRIDRALTRTTIALAIYRAQNGEYPDALGDLTPNVLAIPPVDPIYGGPLGYRRTDNGFLVYSLGFNGADDGGSHDGVSVGFGRQVFEGILIDEIDDPTEAADLTANIPKGADDLSFRAPLPIKPWPWEKPPGDGSRPASVESSSGD